MKKRECQMIAQMVVEEMETLRLKRESQMWVEELERRDDFMKGYDDMLQNFQPLKFEQVVNPKKGLLRRIWDMRYTPIVVQLGLIVVQLGLLISIFLNR
jgi:hypothetical protein